MAILRDIFLKKIML